VLLAFDGHLPVIHDLAWVAPGATLVGDVTVHPDASIWFNAVLRAERAPILVGERSNIQDGCLAHTDPGFSLVIGSGVTVGHHAVLHGCSIEDDVLVGMSATILNGAKVGAQSVVAAGAVVPEHTLVPPRSLVVGVPATVRRRLTDEEVQRIRDNARDYVSTMRRYRGT
jgi:carbonic anhydrase/acetyltransferase-like protein (isoleucine patch superfamily)